MKAWSLLIVDSDSAVRENIKFLLQILHKDKFKTIAEAATFEQALVAYNKALPDLIFLDINLGTRKNGFHFLDQIKGSDSRIIFITADKEHAVKAFRYGVSNYLLKPLSIEEFNEALTRVIAEGSASLHPTAEIPMPVVPDHFDFLFIPYKNGWTKVMASEILYLEANRSYTHIVTDKQTFMVTRSMSKFDFLLEDPIPFLKIHRSYMINVKKIKMIYKKKGGTILMDNDVEIPISASERKRVYQLFNID